MAAGRVPFIDGHNDVLLELRVRGEGARPFLSRRDEGHLDLVRATEGGFAGGFFAGFVLPTPEEGRARRKVRDRTDARGSPALFVPRKSEEERAATKTPDRPPPYAAARRPDSDRIRRARGRRDD